MQTLLSLFTMYILATGCQSSGSTALSHDDSMAKRLILVDTTPVIPPPKPYTGLEYEKKETLSAASGTKSVIFNAKGARDAKVFKFQNACVSCVSNPYSVYRIFLGVPSEYPNLDLF